MPLNLKNLDWGGWAYALIKAAITGAASAIVSYLAMPVLNSVGVTMPNITPRQLLVIVCVGSVTHLAAVVMRSPLPPADGSDVNLDADNKIP